jgi:hypothetical protein
MWLPDCYTLAKHEKIVQVRSATTISCKGFFFLLPQW